jgi:hypothetical protein
LMECWGETDNFLEEQKKDHDVERSTWRANPKREGIAKG